MKAISTKERVLFVCTGNSARSILCEAILRHRAGDRFEVLSAGIEPKGVNPLTLKVLEEIGVNTEGLSSKDVMQYLGRMNIAHAIIVCDHAAVLPFGLPLHPASALLALPRSGGGRKDRTGALAAFRSVRDQIAAKIDQWLNE